MAPIRTASFRKRDGLISIPGAREFSLRVGDDRNLHALVADLADISLISLARAANAFRECVGERYIWMYFYAQEPQSFEPTISPREPFNLEFFGNQLRIRAQYIAPWPGVPTYPDFLEVVARLLRKRNARVMRTEHQDEFGQTRHFVQFDFGSLRGLRVADARAVAAEVSTLAGAVARRGVLDADAIGEVILAGRADLLVGQHEHQTFEAKGVAYALSTIEEQYELAKDVAAFANSNSSGLIVCGLKTTKVRGSDVVQVANPIVLSGVKTRNWVRTIRRLVVPAPEGLRVQTYPRSAASGYVLVAIPRQPENLKPFLVRAGRRATNRIVETDITVPIRIGEDTEFSDAAALHGMLTAGRAALLRSH
jgi:hypothetical protein